MIDNNDPVQQEHGSDKYYDAGENVTVITEPGGDKIITVYRDR